MPSYVVPFQGKTVRFCSSVSRHVGILPVAWVWIKLVGQHCSMLRSSDIKGYLVWSSYEVPGYVVPFQAKPVQFGGSDSRHCRTVPVAWVRIKLVGQHYSILRSTDIEGYLVWSSYEVPGYVVPFQAKMAQLSDLDSRHARTVPLACVRIKPVG
jgi:hypothetical protein